MSFEAVDFLAGLFGPTPVADVPTMAEPSGSDPEPFDPAAYVAEHGCYPPGGIGRPGDIDRWLAAEAVDGGGLPEVPTWEDCLEPSEPCPKCNGLLWWEDLRGGKHCLCCERKAHERALRLAERAARLRQGCRVNQKHDKPANAKHPDQHT